MLVGALFAIVVAGFLAGVVGSLLCTWAFAIPRLLLKLVVQALRGATLPRQGRIVSAKATTAGAVCRMAEVTTGVFVDLGRTGPDEMTLLRRR